MVETEGKAVRINEKVLSEFLIEARNNAWAGEAKEKVAQGIRQIAPFTKSHDFFKLRYIDQYVGANGEPFQGLEVVSIHMLEDKCWIPFWAMGYRGEYMGPVDERKEVNNFLKKALKAAPIDAPFRGPSKFEDPHPRGSEGRYIGDFSEYAYKNDWLGDIRDFSGSEKIIRNGANIVLHSAKYFGGLVNNCGFLGQEP